MPAILPREKVLLLLIFGFLAGCGGGGGGGNSNSNSNPPPPDTQPNAFSFAVQVDVSPGGFVESPAVTIDGIEAPASISIAGGEYSVDGGAFTSASGTITNGQTLVVRVMASSDTNTSASATIMVGGVSATFAVTTLPDTTPSPLGPFAQHGVAIGAVVEFPAVAIGGIDVPVPITIAGGEYAIDAGPFTAASGMIGAGQSLIVRVIAASTTNMLVTATVTIGGIYSDFNVTTLPDTFPDSFSFADQVDLALGAVVESGAVIISGIDIPVPVAVISGEYSIDGGAYSSAVGLISAGQSLELRTIADDVPDSGTSVVVIVGDGNHVVWNVTTEADTTAPTATVTFPPPRSRTSGDTVFLRGTAVDDFSTIVAVRVNGIMAATDDSYAHWRVEVPLLLGENTFDIDTWDIVGNYDSVQASNKIVRNGRFGTAAAIAYDAATDTAYVSDSGMRGLWAVDLAGGGARTILSDRGTPDTQVPFVVPSAIVLEGGRALVMDSSLGAIVGVNLTTGARTLLSGFGKPDYLNLFSSLQDMAFDQANDRLLVLDNAGPNGGRALLAVDLATGARTILSDATTPDATNLFSNPQAIAVDAPGNRALVANYLPNAIYAVDLTSGARTILSDDTTPDGLNPLSFPTSIAVDADNSRALVGQAQTLSIIEVDLGTGARTVFSSLTVPDTANPFFNPREMVVDPAADRLLVIDPLRRRIYAASLADGSRTVASYDDPASVPIPLLDPSGIMLDAGNGRVLVSDFGMGAIRALELKSLDLSVVSDATTPSMVNPFHSPARIVPDLASGRAFILDRGQSGVAAAQILAMDVTTGARTVVTSDVFPGPSNPLVVPFDMALDLTNSRLLVSELSSSTVLAVDIGSGVRAVYSDNATADAINPFDDPQPLVVDDEDSRVLIGNSTHSSDSSLISAELGTGARTVLSGFGTPDVNNWFSDPVGLALDTDNNRVLLLDRQAAQLLAIDLTDGERTLISNNSPPYTNNPIGGPEDVAFDAATGILYYVDDWFSAVVALDTVSGHRVYLLR